MGYRTIHLSNERLRARRERLDAHLSGVIRPLRAPQWKAHFHWANLEHELAELGRHHGGLNLRPEFRRGRAWGREQQTRFIENVFRDAVAPGSVAVLLNCPHWEHNGYAGELPREIQVLDGLQRLTAIRRFMAGELRPFGLRLADFDGSSYCPTRICARFQVTVAVHTLQTHGELLECFLALNGNTPHPARGIARVGFLRQERAEDLPTAAA